jgi:REP element-mobilizing transposase RayT
MKIGHKIRDVSTRKPLHIVLKTNLAYSLQSKTTFEFIKFLIGEIERRYFVSVIEYAVMRSHIHLLVRTNRREDLSNAICFLASKIALRVNRLLKRSGKFWKERYFSSVKRSAVEIRKAICYIANQMRAIYRSPFSNPFSSLYDSHYPFNIPLPILREIGVGKSQELLIFVIESGLAPYRVRGSRAPLANLQLRFI